VSTLAPIGYVIVALLGFTATSSFLIVYGWAAYFFSHKMVRLILLTAPIASICAGIALGYGWAWAMSAIFGDARPSLDIFLMDDEEEATPPPPEQPKKVSKKDTKESKQKKKQNKAEEKEEIVKSAEKKFDWGENILIRGLRLAVSAWAIQQIIPRAQEFRSTSNQIAKQISHPTIITKGRNKQNGEDVLVDDYRQAYFWLRDNTPEDARIMAWWDYGYQITGIANRTTIADGNTWNHEHIALLGRILTSPEKEAHRIARHLADYVLVWAGGGGDDLAKSPHLIRIANSVYRGLCSEATCRNFGMTVSVFGEKESMGSMDPLVSRLFFFHSNRVSRVNNWKTAWCTSLSPRR
jgi:dolichyl-diphosphooligosaccharide--protein glycosyltransferase